MAKESGLGWTTCSVDDGAGNVEALINDVTSLDFGMPRGIQDVTGIDKSAHERLLLLADFTVNLAGVFNPAAANSAHAAFESVGDTSVARTVTLVISGQTTANECMFTDYVLSRAADGSFTWTAPGVLSDGTVPAWT